MSARLDAARDKLDQLTAAWLGAATRGEEAERLALIEPLALAAQDYLAALGSDDDDEPEPLIPGV